MTPLRVRLTGFLSYREPQEVRFANGVWLLAGANGSGKSAIFDGVTYALFGVHRGGSQNAIELIHKESSNAAIEFDFAIGDESFRVKRTLKRTKSGTATATQQLFAAAGESWEPVPDTTKKIDFDAWVHAHIGLTYETFTSSVLLLQNKAEKLLDAKPAGRADVLAGIVDLERYQLLHKRADAKRLTYKGQLEGLAVELEAVPKVADEQFAEATQRVQEANAAKGRAATTVEALLASEGLARQWASAQTRLAAMKEKLRRAEETLTDAVKIEMAHARMQDLNAVLPSVELIVVEKTKIADSDRKAERLRKERDDAKKRKEIGEHGASDAKAKRDLLRTQWQADDAKLHATKDEYIRLAAVLEQVKIAEELQADGNRLTEELRELPNDSAERAKAMADEMERIVDLARLLPAADRFHAERVEREEAVKKETASRAEAERVKSDGEKVRMETERVTKRVAESNDGKSKAEAALAAAKARLDDAKRARAEFDDVVGDKNCRACGQPLTPEHLETERFKRTADVAVAEATVRTADQARVAAFERDADCVKHHHEVMATLDRLRTEYRDLINEATTAKKDAERMAKSLVVLERELPEPLRLEINMAATRERIGTLDATRRTAMAAKALAEKAKTLQTQIESKNQSLARVHSKLPAGDVGPLRELVATKNAERITLANDIKAGKITAEDADRKMDVFGRDAHDAAIRLAELAGKLSHEEQAKQFSNEAIKRSLTNLPASWRAEVEKAGMQHHYEWKQERDDLITANTKEQFQQLAAARGGLESIRMDVTVAERDTEHFPPGARRDPEEIKREITIARRAVSDRDTEVATAEKAKADLDRDRLRLDGINARFKVADLEFTRYKTLAELLGRDRLQRHLVRTAERQIVDHANAVLDRLSAGTLFLRLVAGDDSDDRVLDLECWNRQTGGSPVPVAFLSGGQRFRVAVSLALGIGQYASKQHRPVESVIIDEGFGSLDRNGRQSVIQELHNLRGLLKCVILVSHQEEFADAFPNGYRFEIREGATVVSPLHSNL